MMDIIFSTNTVLYLLQVNIIWAISFLIIWLLVREQSPKLRYYSLLTCQLLLPVAMLISLFLLNGSAANAENIGFTYNVFYDAALIDSRETTSVAASTGLAGLFLNLLYILIPFGGGWLLWRLVRQLVALYTLPAGSDPTLSTLLTELRKQLSIKQKVSLILTRLLHIPCSFGLYRNFIAFPKGLRDQLSVQELKVVLTHELMHIRRHDFLVNLLQKMTLLPFFYNPLLHFCDRLICDTREILCDQASLVNGSFKRRFYAETLLKISTLSHPRGVVDPAIPFYRTSSQLRGRILMIKEDASIPILFRQVMLIAVVLSFCFIAIACSRLNAAEENLRYFENSRYQVTLSDEYVDITEDGKTKRFEKGTAQYSDWSLRFEWMEAGGNGGFSPTAELNLEKQNRIRQLITKAYLQEAYRELLKYEMEKTRELTEEELRALKLDGSSMEHLKDEIAEIEQRLFDLSASSSQQERDKLETRLQMLNARLLEQEYLLSQQVKELEGYNKLLHKVSAAVHQQLQKDKLIGEDEKNFQFHLDEDRLLINNVVVDGKYVAPYKELIFDLAGEAEMEFPITLAVTGDYSTDDGHLQGSIRTEQNMESEMSKKDLARARELQQQLREKQTAAQQQIQDSQERLNQQQQDHDREVAELQRQLQKYEQKAYEQLQDANSYRSKIARLTEIVQAQLLKDGFLKNADAPFRFEIDKNGMKINNEVVDKKYFEAYRLLIENAQGTKDVLPFTIEKSGS